MSQRCFLHVGAAKTGSTSLQMALARDLRNERFLYVSGDRPNGSFALTAMFETSPGNEGPFHAANLPGGFTRYRKHQARRLEQGFELARRQGRDLILSSEETWLWSREGLVNLREALHRHGFSVEVVAYVRPLVPWVQSLFQQAVKMGRRDLSLPRHREFRNLQVRERTLLMWEVFGRERVQVRFFAPDRFPERCVVRDFCEPLGWPVPEGLSWRSNETLKLPAVQLLYAFNRFAGPVGDWGRPIPRGYRALPDHLKSLPGPPLAFHSNLLESWLADLRPEDDWIQRELGMSLWPARLPPDDEHSLLSESELFRYDPVTLDWLACETGTKVVKPTSGEVAARQVAAQVEVLRRQVSNSLIERGWSWLRKQWSGRPFEV